MRDMEAVPRKDRHRHLSLVPRPWWMVGQLLDNQHKLTVSTTILTMKILQILLLTCLCAANAFISKSGTVRRSDLSAQISEKEAKMYIDKVVTALRRDSSATKELGKLEKVTNVLGYGSPSPQSVAVRFNASFRKSGFGLSSVPMPFGLGQSNEGEGRGTMVGQVKASLDPSSGKLTSCSVFRDLGYGRAFNLKC